MQNSPPRHCALGPFQPPALKKESRTTRPRRNYLPDASSALSFDSPAAAIPARVRDAVTLNACKRNERMNLGAFHAHNVVNLNPTHCQDRKSTRLNSSHLVI